MTANIFLAWLLVFMVNFEFVNILLSSLLIFLHHSHTCLLSLNKSFVNSSQLNFIIYYSVEKSQVTFTLIDRFFSLLIYNLLLKLLFLLSHVLRGEEKRRKKY